MVFWHGDAHLNIWHRAIDWYGSNADGQGGQNCSDRELHGVRGKEFLGGVQQGIAWLVVRELTVDCLPSIAVGLGGA